MPTAHGFDEFFGHLYHLSAEEEPETPDFPAAENPRGVIRSWATDEDTGEVDPKFGPYGRQRIEDTGPLNRKRMETVDDEIADGCIDYIRRQHAADTPFFVWLNFTHMHLRTHTKPESIGQAGHWQSRYHDTMIDHDKNVGQVLECSTSSVSPRTRSSCTARQRPPRQLLARRSDHTVPQ